MSAEWPAEQGRSLMRRSIGRIPTSTLRTGPIGAASRATRIVEAVSIESNASCHLPFQVLIDVASALRTHQRLVNLIQPSGASALAAQSRNRVKGSDLPARDDRDAVGELFNQLRYGRGEDNRVMIAQRPALKHALH